MTMKMAARPSGSCSVAPHPSILVRPVYALESSRGPADVTSSGCRVYITSAACLLRNPLWMSGNGSAAGDHHGQREDVVAERHAEHCTHECEQGRIEAACVRMAFQVAARIKNDERSNRCN